MMWTVDQVKTVGSTVYFAFTKIGTYAQSPPEEVWFMSSSNLMTESDPSLITWVLLPEGDHGLAPPGGNPSVMEEGHIIDLVESKGFYALGRTSQVSTKPPSSLSASDFSINLYVLFLHLLRCVSVVKN